MSWASYSIRYEAMKHERGVLFVKAATTVLLSLPAVAGCLLPVIHHPAVSLPPIS